MSPKVTLTAIAGSLKGQKFEFSERTVCIIGRASDCYPQLPNDQEHRVISRYHCLLDINPPMIRVRDFGSLNGTYVNGEKIGQRPLDQTAAEGVQTSLTDYYDLKAGDEIKLGTTIFKVSVYHPDKYLQILSDYDTHLEEKLLKDESSISTSSESTQFVSDFGMVSFSDGVGISGTGNNPPIPCLSGYTFLKQLGKTGLGKVYLAQNAETQEQVAIKVLQPQQPVSQYAIDLFVRDLENAQALKHSHIAQLYDFQYVDGLFWLIQEYCPQGSLTDLIANPGELISIEKAISMILQVLEGLEYAHQAVIPNTKLPDGSWGEGKGMVHRDLKPSNLLLTEVHGKLVVKIGDYGIAKAFDLAGLSGRSLNDSVARMPYFLPRHQVINFKSSEPGTDVWATAAILYFLLTGEYPRDFSDNKDPWLVVLQNQPIPIWKRDASIPIRLAEIVDRALIEKPSIHFKTAAEFQGALSSVRKG